MEDEGSSGVDEGNSGVDEGSSGVGEDSSGIGEDSSGVDEGISGVDVRTFTGFCGTSSKINFFLLSTTFTCERKRRRD